MDVVDGGDRESVRVCAGDDGYFLAVGVGVDLVNCSQEGALGIGLWGIGEWEELEEDWRGFLEVGREEELFEIWFNLGLYGPLLLVDADE